MSNTNDYLFARLLDRFKQSIIMPHDAKVEQAQGIMNNPNYPWKDDNQKEAGKKQLENYLIWKKFYDEWYNEGKKLCVQHENLTNLVARWYNKWREDVSNEGRQETEIMGSQAEILHSIFEEMFKEIKDLNLDIKPPKAMNL